MGYKIEFEDQGQDLLRLECDEKTGEITSAGPFFDRIYADGNHFITVGKLTTWRHVEWRKSGGLPHTFKWPMVKLSLNGQVLCDATEAGA